ncbi:hypothetical protein Ddye_022045 [Dipteronia dyeriana]|uniref:Uncharacterized protein n=1 Tax=Dipteronia dyeriana TaxID=168575 RepID=A0AAD9U2R8_9ROSI|nr:hypothetical protein Ddye_022045 [Dipteronia dyeriana]
MCHYRAFFLHSIKWKTLCKSKVNGGLGIDSVLNKNKGLLAKWVWRFEREDLPLWKRVICAKYGVPVNSLNWSWNRGQAHFFFSKAVGGLFAQGALYPSIMDEGLGMVLGKENRASLWPDIKVDGKTLMEAFPIIFSLASNKLGSVFEYGKRKGRNWCWDVPFRRPCSDGKQTSG